MLQLIHSSIHAVAIVVGFLIGFAVSTASSADPIGKNDRRAVSQLIGEVTLASNIRDLRRRIALQPPESQFESLCRWALPGDDHDSFRVSGYFVPTDAASVVLEDPAFQSQRGPLISPVFDLLRVAKRDGKLTELRRRIKQSAAPADQQRIARAALLALVNLCLDEPDEAAVLIGVVQKSVPKTRAEELWPATLLAYLCVHDYPDLPGGRDVVDSLYSHHVKTGGAAPKAWQSQVMSLNAIVRSREWGAVKTDAAPSAELSRWTPLTKSTARTRGPGGAVARWIQSPQDEINKLGGLDRDYLCFPSPLRGDYTIELDVAANSTTQVLHAGEYSGPGNARNCFELGELGRNSRFVALETAFSKTRDWVRCRVKVSDNIEQVFLNGKRVRQRELSNSGNPWFGIRAWYKSESRFRDVRIEGSPTIPDDVRLDSQSLIGWTSYFDNSVVAEHSHWQWTERDGDGAMHGQRAKGLDGSSAERLLQYHRPLLENGSLDFEFYFEPDQALTSPALDRLAFIFTRNGVAEHWVTDGRFDATELRPDNLQLHAGYQRERLSLKVRAWNHVEMRFSDRTLSIFLNDLLVYERPLDPELKRTFGLFHFADQHEIVARNIIMRGDWPNQIPSPQLLEDPRPRRLDEGSKKLPAVFTHDFTDRQQHARFIRELAFDSNAEFTNIGKSVRTTVRSLGKWRQCALSPSFSLLRDFDAEASFSSLDIDDSASAQIQLAVQLSDEFNRKLIMAIGQDESQNHAVRGVVARANPDGTKGSAGSTAADESVSGRLRVSRRGDQFYALFAQGDSPHWRVLHQETVSNGPVDFGGVQLLTIARTRGTASVVWNDLTLRAEELLFKPTTEAKPARVLTILRVDGTETRDLTPADNPMKILGSPVWSPDGKRIAWQQFPQTVRDSHIMIVDVDGGQPIDLGPGNMPDFSPDGKQIVFSNSRGQMSIMNADGSGRRRLVDGASGPVWKPDGKQLSFSNGRNIILLRNLDDKSGPELLTKEVAARYSRLYWNLNWSADGRRLTFTGVNRQTGETELAMVSMDQPQKFTVLYSGFGHPHVDHCWSPTEEQILVPITPPGSISGQLHLLDPTGQKKPKPYPNAPAVRNVAGADWSPDGKWIAITAQPVATVKQWPELETSKRP